MNEIVPKVRFQGFTDDWEQRELGDLVVWSKGNKLAKNVLNQSKDGDEVIHYADLYKFSAVVNDVIHWSQSGEGTAIPDNSLLFPMSDVTPFGLARTSTITKREVRAGSDILIGTLINANASFVSYQVNAHSQKILPLVTGTTVKHISSRALSKLDITIPQNFEQEKIGLFFQQLDNLITLHQRKLDLLKEQKKGFLQKMFPKNGQLVPEVRFEGFADDWEQRKLGDFVTKAIDNRGKTPPTLEKGRHPLLEVASIGGYYPNYFKVSKYVTTETYNTWFRAHLKKDDILFSTVGNTGLATLMDDYQGAAIAQNIVGFRASENAIPEFLLQMFKLPNNLKKAKRIEMGAVQPSIKVSQLIDVKYFLPKSIEEQQKIGSFFKQLDNLITLHQRKLDLLKEQKKGFLQKMFVS